MSNEVLLWVGFSIVVLVMLALDLLVFNRQAHAIKIKEALRWSIMWITLALLFDLVIYFTLGSGQAIKFLTGYLLEKSLSVDNLFVFLLLFSYFSVPSAYQHKVLFWGIIGALIMRGIFIATGLTIISKIHWVIYLFGAFLIFTGIRLSLQKDKKIHPEHNPVLRLFRRFVPTTSDYQGDKFFVRKAGRYLATPLLAVLLAVETTDIVFAVDSVPAVLAVTLDPFIVYTSNIFAILGLRALFFLLAGIMQGLRYLNYGLSAILVFLGFKMLLSSILEIPTGISLGIIAIILLISILVSVLRPRGEASVTTPTDSSVEKDPKSASQSKD